MRIGFSAPFRGHLANARDIRTMAGAAESNGYGMLSVALHIVVQATVANYPDSRIH